MMAASASPGRWLGVAALLLALAGALVAWLALRAPMVDAVTVQAVPLVRTLQFSARVAAQSKVDVGSTLTGRVSRVLVDEGAPVRQGDLLLELETGELEAALAQALATEQQARARLAGLRSTGRMAASAALAQAEATLRAAAAELARTEQLVAQGFLSAARLDDARRAVAVAQAQRDNAQAQHLSIADAGTDLAQTQAQLAVAQAASAAARARQAQAVVRAPADALVLSRDVEPGQIVQPGRALMTLALAGPTQLSAQVDERFLEQLAPGQQARVVADAFPGQRFSATVLSLAPAVDAQRGAIEVLLSLGNDAPAFLREDMSLSVEVETGRREHALVLPLEALRGGPPAALGQPATGARLLVLADGRAQERTVRLGLQTLEAVEVQEGLSAGDVVLLGDQAQAGQRVRIRPVGLSLASPGEAVLPEDAGSALTRSKGR